MIVHTERGNRVVVWVSPYNDIKHVSRQHDHVRFRVIKPCKTTSIIHSILHVFWTPNVAEGCSDGKGRQRCFRKVWRPWEVFKRTSNAFNAVSMQHCFKVPSIQSWSSHSCQATLMVHGAQTQNDRWSSFCLQKYSYMLYSQCCIADFNQAWKKRLQTIVRF